MNDANLELPHCDDSLRSEFQGKKMSVRHIDDLPLDHITSHPYFPLKQEKPFHQFTTIRLKLRA
jgi:hypothetical protein